MALRRVLVSGASGMVGRALVAALSVPSAANGFAPAVSTLVRRPARAANEVFWDGASRIDLAACEGFDAVVHLAGENVGSGSGGLSALTGRWDARKKHDIMASRRDGTRLLARSLAALRAPPRVLVTASGVGFYGAACGDAELGEDAPRGAGFLADVAAEWEAAAAPAAAAGVRVVNLRFGVVLSATGGVIGAGEGRRRERRGRGQAGAGGAQVHVPKTNHAIPRPPPRPRPPAPAKLRLPFSLCLGGPIGSGAQWMSWITLADAVRSVEFALAHGELAGPVNAVAPAPARAAEFSAALGAALGRPAVIPLPAPAVRAVFGEMGEETLLASQRALPRKLLAAGFKFAQPDIEAGCREALLR